MIKTNLETKEKFILENEQNDLKLALKKIIDNKLTKDIFYKKLSHAPLYESIVINVNAGEIIYDFAIQKNSSINFTDNELFALRKLSDELFELIDEENFFERSVFLRKPSVQEMIVEVNSVLEFTNSQRKNVEGVSLSEDEIELLSLFEDSEISIGSDY